MNSAKERALKECGINTVIGNVITGMENPGRFLQILADAVEGKHLWSKRDTAINKAIRKAMGFDGPGQRIWLPYLRSITSWRSCSRRWALTKSQPRNPSTTKTLYGVG
jgi:hypothetical protein